MATVCGSVRILFLRVLGGVRVMYRLRKPNRVSRPLRIVQRGTKTTYPSVNWAAMRVRRNRYAGSEVLVRGFGG